MAYAGGVTTAGFAVAYKEKTNKNVSKRDQLMFVAAIITGIIILVIFYLYELNLS